MGYRVHVISKRAEYGESEAFNWTNEEFKDLLRECGCTICEEDPDGYCANWETLVSGYEIAMQILTKIANGEDIPETVTNEDTEEEIDLYKEDILEAIEKVGYKDNVAELVKIMQALYDERDKNCDYIMFAAW
jgi:hypothetical protein